MNLNRTVSLKKTIALLTIATIFIGLFNAILWVQSTSGTTPSIAMQNGSLSFSGNLTYNGNNITDLVADPQTSASSYTFAIENTNYFARNSSGRIIYSGTNCSTVVSNTVTNAPTGSSFDFGAGHFQLDDTINGNKTMMLEGQGITYLEMTSNGNGKNMINLTGDPYNGVVGIDHMTINASGHGYDAVYVNAGHYSLIDLGVYDASDDCIHVAGGSGGKWDQIYAYGATRYCVYFNGVDHEINSLTIGSDSHAVPQVGFYCLAGGGTKVDDYHIWGCMYGVELGDTGNSANRIYFGIGGINDNQRNAVFINGSGVYDSSFIGTEFKENGDEVGYYGTYDAIFGNGTGVAVQRLTIEACNFDGQGTRSGTVYNLTRYAINFTGCTKSNIVIQGNTILPLTFAGKVNNYSPLIVGIYMIDDCEVQGNVGEVWDTWGADTFAASTTSMYLNLTNDYGMVGPIKTFTWSWETAPQGRTMYFTENQTMVHLWMVYCENGSTASCSASLTFCWAAKYYP